ncbi:MAG: hypothetical protein EAZ40_07320, partial [Rhodobacterales bacterium]
GGRHESGAARRSAHQSRQIRGDHRIGLLVVEHDLKLIMRLCDHIVVLNKGQMIAEGTPEDIRSNPAVIEAYIGKRRAAA